MTEYFQFSGVPFVNFFIKKKKTKKEEETITIGRHLLIKKPPKSLTRKRKFFNRNEEKVGINYGWNHLLKNLFFQVATNAIMNNDSAPLAAKKVFLISRFYEFNFNTSLDPKAN